MNPPAPGPVRVLSATQETRAAPTAASTAFPPSRSTLAPASAVSGWPAAIAPRIQGNVVRTRQTERPVARPKGRRAPPARPPLPGISSQPRRGLCVSRPRRRRGGNRRTAGALRTRRPRGRTPDLAVGGRVLFRRLVACELVCLAVCACALRWKAHTVRCGGAVRGRVAGEQPRADPDRRGGAIDALRAPARGGGSRVADGRGRRGARRDGPGGLRRLRG